MSDKKVATGRTCFVPGCRTGYSSDIKAKKVAGEINPSLFKAPNDPAVLKEWNRAIPRADKMLGPKNVVCSLHFADEEIIHFYETKMPDGTIHKIKRGWPLLKEGSVPSIFPNFPPYFSSIRREISPCVRNEVQTEYKKIKKDETVPSAKLESFYVLVEGSVEGKSLDPNENEAAISVVSPEKEKNPNLFQCLKDSLDKFLTPNGSWSGAFLPGKNEIIFTEWDESYTAKKKIIISSNMSYKVLFGSSEVKISDSIITDFIDLQNIIKLINKMRVCEGIITRTPDLCSGNLPARKPGQKGALTKYCAHCKLKYYNGKKEVKPFIAKRHQKLN